MRLMPHALLALFMLVPSGRTWAQAWERDGLILPSVPVSSLMFGTDLALDGDVALVGAEQFAAGPGQAYMLTWNGTSWVEQRLLPSEALFDDRVGESVALDGDTAVIGALEDDVDGVSNAGSVYVFVSGPTEWIEQAWIPSPVLAEHYLFGRAVAVSGDTLAVTGLPAFGGAGAVHVYERDAGLWTLEATITPDAPQAEEAFGHDLALQGDTLVVSALHHDAPGATDAGAVHVFVRDGSSWSQQATLTADDAATGDRFGLAVDLDGVYLAVGAYGVNGFSGAAYVFEQVGTSWIQRAQVMDESPTPGAKFGLDVDLSVDTLAVAGRPSFGDGAVTVFARAGTDWNQQTRLVPADVVGVDDGPFAESVALCGDRLLAGAPAHTHSSQFQAGSVTHFERTAGVWASVGAGIAGSFGTPTLGGIGQLAGGDLARIALSDAVPGGTTNLLIGLTALQAPFKGGTLVPSPDILLAGIPLDGDGSVLLSAAWPAGLPGGLSVWFQHWIADGAAPKGFSASNGLQATTP